MDATSLVCLAGREAMTLRLDRPRRMTAGGALRERAWKKKINQEWFTSIEFGRHACGGRPQRGRAIFFQRASIQRVRRQLMAIPTPVNGQITDAVTQANVKVLGDAPAMAMGAIYQSLAHSTGILYENATSSQQQLAIAAQAATNQGVIQIYSVDTMAGAVATSKIAQSDTPDNMLSLLTALRAVGPAAGVS
jgi:hypothetical protein